MSSMFLEGVLHANICNGVRLSKRLQPEADAMKKKVRETGDKIKQNKGSLVLLATSLK